MPKRPSMLGNRILINVHVPKTAGTTLGRQLRAALALAGQETLFRNIFIRAPDRDDRPCEQALAEELRRHLAALAPDAPAVLTGHFHLSEILPVIEPFGERVRLITFLRDPVERTLSDYFYCLTEEHNMQEQFLQRYPRIENYLATPDEVNKHWLYLRPHRTASVEETIATLRERFHFVGVTERFEQDLGRLLDELGLPRPSALRINVGGQHGVRAATRALQLDLIRRSAAPDIAICRAFGMD